MDFIAGFDHNRMLGRNVIRRSKAIVRRCADKMTPSPLGVGSFSCLPQRHCDTAECEVGGAVATISEKMKGPRGCAFDGDGTLSANKTFRRYGLSYLLSWDALFFN